MFRNLSLRSLYEEQDELTPWQRIALSVVWNVCPVIVFMGAFWAFRTWVWTEPPMIVNWK